jgi:hypothetical protein
VANAVGWQQGWQRGNSEGVAPGAHRVPGVYRRGGKFVAVYRERGRQHKQSAESLAQARAIVLAHDARARATRRGPTLHAFSLSWLDSYAGSGHDSLRASTRRGTAGCSSPSR